MLDEFGTLSVRAFVARGALPVSGAVVRITGAEEQNRSVIHSLITDRDGVTPPVSLPAPNRNLSLTPHPSATPYALYDIEVSADGYFPKKLVGVPVFPGIYSLQPVNMIPESADFPRGNVNAVTPESNLPN